MATAIQSAVNPTLLKAPATAAAKVLSVTKIPRLNAKAPAPQVVKPKASVPTQEVKPEAPVPQVAKPQASVPKAKAAAKAPGQKKERVVDPKNWESYILKLKKATRPDVNISKVTVPMINQLLLNTHSSIVKAAEAITVAYEYQTIDMKSIRAAVRSVIPKELIEEVEAVAMAGCDNSDPKILNPPKRTRAPPKPKDPNAPKAPKVAKPKAPRDPNAQRKPAVMRNDKAGLNLPIPRVEKLLRVQIEGSTGLKRVGAGVPIYLTGVLEGLCSYIINTGADLILNAEDKSYKLQTNHIIEAVNSDVGLRNMFASWLLSVDSEAPVQEEEVDDEHDDTSSEQPTNDVTEDHQEDPVDDTVADPDYQEETQVVQDD